MKSWVLFEPEQITTTADRDPSSEITAFRRWASKIRDLGNYEVKFYLTDARYRASAPSVFVVNARWNIDDRSSDGNDKPFAVGSGFTLPETEAAAVTDVVCADQGPFYALHTGPTAKAVVVRVAVRKIRSA